MSFWDQLTGASAAEASTKAADDTYQKQRAAAASSRAAGADYQSGINDVSQAYNPYVHGGTSALSQLMGGLGLKGAEGSQNFAAGYQNLPGYQSALDTGAKTVTTQLNAGPGIQSGAAMKALQKYGQNYEDQKSGDYLTRLMSLGQQGLGATQSQTGLQAQGYGGQLQANLAGAGQMYGSAGTVGQGQIAGANAQAAGSQNLLNTGIKVAGMALAPFTGGASLGALGSSFGTSTGANPLGSMMSQSGSNPFNPNGTRNTMAYGYG